MDNEPAPGMNLDANEDPGACAECARRRCAFEQCPPDSAGYFLRFQRLCTHLRQAHGPALRTAFVPLAP